MRPLRLDLRKLFRRLGKEHQQDWSSAIAAAGGPAPKDGGNKGGSLPKEIMRATYLKVKRWGYILQVSRLGQKLTWYTRGTSRQPARPIEAPEVNSNKAAKLVGEEIVKAFNAYSRDHDRGGARA